MIPLLDTWIALTLVSVKEEFCVFLFAFSPDFSANFHVNSPEYNPPPYTDIGL